MRTSFAICGIIFLAAAAPAAGQAGFPNKMTVQLRLGAFGATSLVTDQVSSETLNDSIPGVRSAGITIAQKPGPMGTLAVRLPLRPSTQMEMSASVGYSMVRGEDGLVEWDVAGATVANAVVGFGFLYRPTVAVRVGAGVTKLFAEDRGLFRGNKFNAMVEGGASGGTSVAGWPVELDVRVQAHRFTTPTLEESGAEKGDVMRVVIQVGTTLWKAGNE